jgi:hypothetical protein
MLIIIIGNLSHAYLCNIIATPEQLTGTASLVKEVSRVSLYIIDSAY